MKGRLPLYIENLDLPDDNYKRVVKKGYSYGYVSILYILSLVITGFSIVMVLVLGK